MGQLDINRIARAALGILDKEGVAGFTIRNVAADLNVTPMALYHHVRNKAELATLVVEYANKDLPRSPPTGRSGRRQNFV